MFKPEEVVRQKIINWLIDDLGLHSLQFLDDNAIKAGVLEVELLCFVACRPEAPCLGLCGAGVPPRQNTCRPDRTKNLAAADWAWWSRRSSSAEVSTLSPLKMPTHWL